jgi:hypothetical protein
MRDVICNWLFHKSLEYADAAQFWFRNPKDTIGWMRGEVFLEWSKLYLALAEAILNDK